MYSIFNGKSKIKNRLQEGEPPTKKFSTENNAIIKDLARNQLKTNQTLTQLLNKEKDFCSNELITNITGCVQGEASLKNFKETSLEIDYETKLLSSGLTNRDIQIYKDYYNGDTEFWLKYQDINRDILEKHVQEISEIIKNIDSNNTDSTDRFPSALDELPQLEEEFTYNINEYSRTDIKKIRKKARALGKKLTEISEPLHGSNIQVENNILDRPTLWDVKEKPSESNKIEIVDKSKMYSCKPQTLYTIKDGKIVKVEENNTIKKLPISQGKLTEKEIRAIEKFSNYEAGTPSKSLYLKNLSKSINDSFLKQLLGNIFFSVNSIKIMKGKMRGQCFIQFKDEINAGKGFELLNGILVDGKPIIAQFGNKSL